MGGGQLREMLTTADVNEDGVISHEEFVGAYETISWVRAQVNTSAARKTCRIQSRCWRTGCVQLNDTDCANMERVGL